MSTLRGKLEFISLWDPIKLQIADETIDLRDYFFPLFEKWNEKKGTLDYTKKYFIIKITENSEDIIRFEYDKEDGPISFILKTPYGFKNLGAYLPGHLQFFNGQYVDVDIEDDFIKIAQVEDQTLYGVYFTKDNSCKIPDDDVKNICQPGTSHCCIFLTVAGDGFYCDKFDTYMARNLLYRYKDGTMNANRIGDCELLGRKETTN